MKPEGEHIGLSTRRPLVTLVGVASAEWSQKQDSVGWEGTGRQGWRREVPTTGFREASCKGGVRDEGAPGQRPVLARCLFFKGISPKHVEMLWGWNQENGHR